MAHSASDARRDVFVVTAHQDDWPLFMSPDVYAYLRDPHAHVVFIVTTAGGGRHPDFHWRARLNGCVLAAMRALPSWNPYLADPDALPTTCAISYARERLNDQELLTCTIDDPAAASIRMYFLHARDGGGGGEGFAPHFESLAQLYADGKPLGVCWPPNAPPYATWSAFVETLGAIVARERREGGTAALLAADSDAVRNPGDHPDHRTTTQALRELIARDPSLVPTWYAMYVNTNRAENLAGAPAEDQRTAIFSYGAGYTATVAGLTESWPRPWEAEYPAFKNRQYREKNP